MITPEELEKEKQYLKKVCEVLNNEIENYNSQVKSLSNNIQEQMSYAWDKTNRLSDTEFIYAVANIQKRSVYAENANKKLTSYKKMLNNAYFARIDFDDGEEILPVYIGIASLQQGDDFYVYDWRAPISSMFYNSEVGDASYTISSGEKITGKITLKRQYKISNGELIEVFDTDMQIIDSILKRILSENASSKMKNIVNTIQKEQNEIIRKNNVDILVVQGPAGSGKTSIAMHKIAYLLYSERDKINNSNVMILSPNDIFNNYISDVLPDIGEDNVVQATFIEFAKAYINEYTINSKIEDIYEIVYSERTEETRKKYQELKFKHSQMYINILLDHIEKNKISLFGFEPIEINDQVIMTVEEMEKIANSIRPGGESLYNRGKKIIERIFMSATQKTQKHLTLEKIKVNFSENLTKIKSKIASLYESLYASEEEFISFVKSEFEKYGKKGEEKRFDLSFIYNETKKSIDEGILEYQDVTPFMFLKSKIIGIQANKNIKYVMIDEAQDYSITQFKILAMLFKNANISLLGDINQCISPFNSIKNYDKIVEVLKIQKQGAISTYKELSKTYRSTYEINDFAKKLFPETAKYSQVDRHGDDIKITKLNEFNVKDIINRALELKKSYNTVAIICKNISETLLYSKEVQFQENPNLFRMVTKNDNIFVSDKIMIIPSYLSKGLEFDAVIVSNASSEKYIEKERNLFYVVLTRALHKLELFYTGELTKLITGDTNEK